MPEKEKVKLRNINGKDGDKDNPAVKEFDKAHAEQILKYQEDRNLQADWILHEDSGYKFDNGTLSRDDTGAAKKSSGKGANS